MGPKDFRILWAYWDQLRMVVRAGGYYGLEFQGFRGATQGNPLPPTIFNMMVDEVVTHWVEVVVKGAGEQGGRRQEVRHQNSLFYADDGMVVASYPGWLQGEFSTLVGMLKSVGLNNNAKKTVRMVCHTCQAAGTQSEAPYERRMTGAGPSYRERQLLWVQ